MASLPSQVVTMLLSMTVLSYVMVVSEGCNNPPPGIRRMIRGVDITQLDLLPLEPGLDGFKNPVINFTCNQDRTWRSPRGGNYQLWHLNSLPGGLFNAEAKIYKTYQDVKRTMTRNVGGKFNIIRLGFSASKSYKDMQNTIVNTSHVIADVSAFDSATQADFIPSWRLKLDMFAQEYVDQMLPPFFESNPTAYNRFIQEFGTHYFASANYGGFIRVIHEINSNYFSSTTESEVETQSKRSFLRILSGRGGRVSSPTEEVSERFRQATTVSTRYYGGYTNLLKDNGIQQWQPTVYNDPWLFSGTLKPISDLITDESKKNSMIRAVTTYVSLSYLDELDRLLASVKSTSKLPEVNRLKSRVSALKGNTVLKESGVRALGLEIGNFAARATSPGRSPSTSSRADLLRSTRVDSGSTRVGSGSTRLGSGSTRLDTGSTRVGSGSTRLGIGSTRVSSGFTRRGIGSTRDILAVAV